MTEAIILGLDWWTNGVPPSPRKMATRKSQKGKKAAATTEVLPGSPQVPREYWDLAEAFSEEECNTLPPHPPTDCTIEFVPEANLPKPKMYSLTPREMTELREYINAN